MKRLMVMTGRAGKALLEINGDRSGAAVKYGGPGELWLFDGEGNSCRGGRPPFIPVGAMAVKNGTVLLTGGFAGKKELMERAKAEIMLRSPVPEKPRCDKERPAEKPSAPERQIYGGQSQPQQPRQRPPQSQALLEILQRAAELFPQDMGRQSAPPKEEPADRNEDAVNPFPEAFPFSRWKRISYPGTDRYYLEGEARMQGATYRIHALPGEYRPGRRPKGFDRFLRARDGSGYWVRVRREQ